MNAVIIEQDYKGCYERFALTPAEFKSEYLNMPPPCEKGDSQTLKPMVHIWFKLVEIHSVEWNVFFTDMTYGLPESDIDANNHAYINIDACLSLKPYVSRFI